MNTTPQFAWKSAYMGCRWFAVCDKTGAYEIEERYEAGDYERSIMNRSVDWDRDILGAVGLIRRTCNSGVAIPADTVKAFNSWRLADHVTWIAELDSQPERYDLPAGDPIRQAPPVVRGAVYEIGTGFIVTE